VRRTFYALQANTDSISHLFQKRRYGKGKVIHMQTKATNRTIRAQPPVKLPEEGLVRVQMLAPLLGVSERTIWRKVDAGTFPRPVPISPATRGWRVEEVRAWMESLR